MSVRKGTDVIAGHVNYRPDLFDHKWADHVLNNPSWLCADTFSWQDGGIYEAAYNHLAADIDGKSLSSETISGVTVQFYLADDGHKICPVSQESNVSSLYTATGVAWYYIIDTVNERFKLPRTKWAVTGLRGNVGDYVAQDVLLPNVSGHFSGPKTKQTYSGPFYQYGTEGGAYPSGTNTQGNIVGFDMSRVSSVYSGDGTNTFIQPRGTQQHLYFYVGNFTQTALENTAGVVTEDFNELNAHKVIDFQEPTSVNNYTWYRKYADGWVEQGGRAGTGTTNSNPRSVVFPIEMADTNYHILGNPLNTTDNSATFCMQPRTLTTTGMEVFCTYAKRNDSGASGETYCWEVRGMAA